MKLGSMETDNILNLSFNPWRDSEEGACDYVAFIADAINESVLTDFFEDESNGFDQEEKDHLQQLKDAVARLQKTLAANSR